MATNTFKTKPRYISHDGLLYTSKGVLDARFDVTDIDRARMRYFELQEAQARENVRKANEIYLKAKRRERIDEALVAAFVMGVCSFGLLMLHYLIW